MGQHTPHIQWLNKGTPSLYFVTLYLMHGNEVKIIVTDTQSLFEIAELLKPCILAPMFCI